MRLEGVKTLIFDLTQYFLNLKSSRLDIIELCSLTRSFSFIAYLLSREYQSKLSFKIEGYAFVHLPNCNSNELVEMIKYISRIYSGGTIMLWKYID